MIRPEEKLKLMLELGMEDAADKFAEANNLTTMKFRPISLEKIDELLAVEYQEMSIGTNPEMLLAFGIIGAIMGAFLGSLIYLATTSPLLGWSTVGICAVLGIIVCYFLGKPRMETHTADVCQMPLKEWDDNLPYGALLSVKEAKVQGYKDFTIFFPAKDDSQYAEVKRLKADPIIVALKKGHGSKMYNIFAWDDGKVYE